MDKRIEYDRVYSFDVLKAIMAFMVCIIHWSDQSDYYYLVPTRIAVPVFIAISGYFWPKEKEKQISQIKKIFTLLIGALLFYFGFYFILKLSNRSLHQWLSEVFSIRAIMECLVFNRAKLGGHLWYLFAVLYTMIITMILQEKKCEKLFPCLCVAGVLGLLIAGKYSLLLLGSDVPTFYTKTYYCVGIPFFAFGMYLKSEQAQAWIEKVPNLLVLTWIILFCASGFLEKAVLRYFSVEGTRDFYISTVLLVGAIMVFAVKNQKFGYSFPLLRRIGEKYSGTIYVIHIAVITVVSKGVGLFAVIDYLYHKIGFILVFFISLAFSVVWEKRKHFRSLIEASKGGHK